MEKLQNITFWLCALLIITGTRGLAQSNEKVFIHTDKPFYITGETIWMKAYGVDPQSQKLLPSTRILYLELLDKSARPVMQEKIMLRDGMGKGQWFIHPGLGTGNYYLKAYTKGMKGGSTEDFFEKMILLVNPFEISDRRPAADDPIFVDTLPRIEPPRKGLLVEADKHQYDSREKVKLTVKLDRNSSNPIETNLSVSVYKYHPGLDPVPLSIPDEFTGQQRPNLTLTEATEEMAGINHPVIKGNLKPNDDRPLPERFFITIPGQSTWMYMAQPDENGDFSIEISPEIKTSDLLFWGNKTDLSKYTIDLESPYTDHSLKRPFPPFFPDKSLKTFIEACNLNIQLSNAYLPGSNIRGLPLAERFPPAPFFGTSNIKYMLDEYTRFPTMEEVFIEYVRYVDKRKRDGKQHFFMWDLYANENSISNTINFQEPGLVMVDGVPVGDLQTIWDFDPLKIESIQIVNRKYYLEDYFFYGIIYFDTYDGDFGGQKLPGDVIRKEFIPVLQPRDFYTPDYQSEQASGNRLPDRRNVLYWNPDVMLQSEQYTELEFYTADDGGIYRVEVNGLTADGEAIFAVTEFEVIKSGWNR